MNSEDTIAAVATALGTGGVGIIRVSGPDAGRILSTVMATPQSKICPRTMQYGHVRDGDERIDEVLYVLMPGPRSFTGEDVAEIHGHGGSANLGRILRTVIGAGARHAEPGEFTRRAFENGRIDLTRAEAIADIVNASSEKALRVAQQQLAGQLGDRIASLSQQVLALTAEIEAGIDFPEDGLSDSDRDRQQASAQEVATQCLDLARTYGLGKVLRDGIDVVLRGPVNAGKSSLFNRLVGHDRALVSETAGTTRDYVEAQVVWEGVRVTLVDTAGLRGTDIDLEERGIAMGSDRAALADLELLVCTPDTPIDSRPTVDPIRQLLVLSKCDTDGTIAEDSGYLRTSAHSGLGIEALKRALIAKVSSRDGEAAEGCVITNERQRSRLQRVGESMTVAAGLIAASAPSEVIIVELNTARQALAEVTGDEIGDEMLDALFAQFCIGK